MGGGLNADSCGFSLSAGAVETLRAQFSHSLAAPAFSHWLAAFFTGSAGEDTPQYGERDDIIGLEAFTEALQSGAALIKPAYVKFALVPSVNSSAGSTYSLGFDGRTFDINDDALAVVLSLMKEDAVTKTNTPMLSDHLDLLCKLYNRQALEFSEVC